MVGGGQLYVDGRVLDNLPVGVMKRFAGGKTIAVEATVKVEFSVDGRELPSPLEYLRSRILRRERQTFPTLPSLLIKSSLLGGASGRRKLREGVDLYINPPMRAFGFLDWDAIHTIVDVGYRHAQACLRPWLDQHPELQWREDFAVPARETMPA
jgi:predicted acylesterase/phospholipase RssA